MSIVVDRRSVSPERLFGDKLKSATRLHLQRRLDGYLEEGSSYVPLVRGLLDNYDLIVAGTDPGFWDTPRGNREIRNTVGSFCASMHYAHIKTGKRESFLSLFDQPVSSSDKWQFIIQDTLGHEDSRRIFQENAWRAPTTAFPDRGVPLQYILSHEFGRKPVVGVDLGAGLHIMLPLLNSSHYTQYDFPGRVNIQQYAQYVNVIFGLGVDKQDADEDWAQACIWPDIGGLKRIADFRRLMEEVKDRVNQDNGNDGIGRFPLIKQDILTFDGLSVIKDILFNSVGQRQADFVNSSFVRQFLGDTPEVQDQFNEVIKKLLKAGGILIDSGIENIQRDKPGGTMVVVHRKIGGELAPIGIPFTLANQISVNSVDLSYFEYPPNVFQS